MRQSNYLPKKYVSMEKEKQNKKFTKYPKLALYHLIWSYATLSWGTAKVIIQFKTLSLSALQTKTGIFANSVDSDELNEPYYLDLHVFHSVHALD